MPGRAQHINARRALLMRAGLLTTIGSRLRGGLSWAAAPVLLGACASRPALDRGAHTAPTTPSSPKPLPGDVALTLRITASRALNPDARDRPSPVLLRIYALRSAQAFETADFMSLYLRDTAVLGADLLAREEAMVSPGENAVVTRAVPATTRVVGVLAAFRAVERAQWRAVLAMPSGRTSALAVSVAPLAVLPTEGT